LPEHVIIDVADQEALENKVDISKKDYDDVDPVLLSVYGHRLMGIAEQVRPRIRPVKATTDRRWEIF
jgi:5-oxoprolinase (ATP-hydrolysing)